MSTAPLPASSPLPVLADLLPGARVRDVALVGSYVLAIALSAQLAFPLPGTPVPVTAQTFVVLLGAAALGTTRAALGGALFVGIGLAGVPWFAVTGGATSGYLLGFVVAAGIVGAVARRRGLSTFPRAVVAMAVADAAILVLGALGLMLVGGLGVSAAIVAGVVPFVPGEVLKVTTAAALLPATQRRLDR